MFLQGSPGLDRLCSGNGRWRELGNKEGTRRGLGNGVDATLLLEEVVMLEERDGGGESDGDGDDSFSPLQMIGGIFPVAV